MASSSVGKAKMASMISVMMRSSQPPKKPEMSPSTTPMKSENATDSRTTSIAVRAPHMTRDSTSNSRPSVPNQCWWLGGASFGNGTPFAEC